MGRVAGVFDNPPGFPCTPPGVDILEGGKLTSNNVAGSSHDPLQSPAVASGAVSKPGWKQLFAVSKPGRFRRCIVQSTLGMAPLNLCFNILFYVFLLSLFTRITSALFIYDRRTLLDIGHHCTNLLQDTLSTDPAWPLEILRSTEVNKGRLNNPRRRRKHRGRRAGIRNRLRKRAHSPPLPSILLANVQSLENKMDDLRARISFQRDIRDCNILF